jgi:hypothetical protein
MSFLGGRQPAAAVPTQLNSINVDQSRYGDPVPLLYGVQRIPMTLLWYGAFTSSAQYSSGSGKGGKGPPSSYAYTASCVMGLCEGPISAIKQVWKDKDLTTLATEDLTLFLGAGGQTAWPYLTSNFPAQAVPYDHTAYVAEANLALGNSAALPNYTFEAVGFLAQPGTPITFTGGIAANGYSTTIAGTSPVADGLWDVTFSDNESRTATFATVSGTTTVSWDSTLGLINAVSSSAIAGGYDAEPSAVLLDYCTDVNHGAGFAALSSTIQGTGPTTWQTYCIANGLYFSPWEDTQRPAADFLKDMLEMTNSNGVMSAGTYYIFPYGDSPVTGNGRAYVPNLTPLFFFDDDDLMPNNQGTNTDPVVMTRKSLKTETYNVVRIEFLDRGNSYNMALAEWTDPLDIAVNGIRVMPNKTFHQICDARVAHQVAGLIGQRQLYILNTYAFTVRADYSITEPGDLVAVTDSLVIDGIETRLGLVDRLLRVIETEDDQNDIFTITAEEMFIGTASAPKYNFQSAQGYAANFAVEPESAGVPLIFSAPAPLVGAGGGYQLWVAAGPGAVGEWGGAQVYGSLDTVTYSYLGAFNGQARYGSIPANVGTTDASVNVTLTAAAAADGLQLTPASASDYANNRSLIYLDGEIIGFEGATLIGSGEYTLSPVTRGLFGTGPSPGVGLAHTAGAKWARLDETILKTPFDAGMVGQTIDLKFCAFNSLGRATQTLADATAYPHLIEIANGGALLAGPLTLKGFQMGISGNQIFKSTNTAAWDSGAWSLQGYTNGAFVSFRPAQANLAFLLGLHSAPGLTSYAALDYALYCTEGGALYAYESDTASAVLGTYVAGDDLSVTYDGAIVRYIQNSNLIRQVSAPKDLTLYVNSAFYDYNAAVTDIRLGADGVSTPVLFVSRGNCLVSDSLIFKQGGTSSWVHDDAYSINAYPTCNLIFKTNDTTGQIAAGFCTSIPQSPDYALLDYAFFCLGGTYYVWVTGVGEVGGVTGTYTTTSRFTITYNGTAVVLAIDGATVHTV